MSRIDDCGARERALRARDVTSAPASGDPAPAALSSSARFAIGQPGDAFVMTIVGNPAHVLCGTSTVTATTSAPLYHPGTYKLWLPDGCTDVAMIQSSAGAATGSAHRCG